MHIKSIFAKPWADWVQKRLYRWADEPVKTQQKVFKKLIAKGVNTKFGKDHNFYEIMSYDDFKNQVPVRDYEGFKPYIESIKQGETDILWPGKPIYFAKTSGTTSGTKYIPITKTSMPHHIEAARNALLMYIAETGKSDFLEGKMIFLQGSPVIEEKNGIKTGRLSGIVAHYVPKYLQKNRMPSWEVNCIEDWETKVNAIVEETLHEDMTLISGIPSWVQMYFEKLISKAGKSIGELFPNFDLFVYGGVNYEPYRSKFEKMIGKKVDAIELYPASEGFFAFQDRQDERGMLLLLNSGIFYEFIAVDDYFNEDPRRISVADVQLGVNYVMLISTDAGLWAYNIGDTVAFTSLYPHRIIVTGRIKHFISAFGEHVIAKEVEQALQKAVDNTTIVISEFTVAPQVNPTVGLPYHEWFIEFEKEPEDMTGFSNAIDRALQGQNSYYLDLIQGHVLQPLRITRVAKDGFQNYMKSIGKLGGQNKVPRLSNDRKIADELKKWILK
ncbi:MAG: GH3 auxin-responsive promoter family protein [Flavobacteriaceae bacterium]|nr:GH3 auxin-responsive promoter family protein [Flavobacteriaceae bacterium]